MRRVATLLTATVLAALPLTLIGRQDKTGSASPKTGAISGIVIDGVTGQALGDAIVSITTDEHHFTQPSRQQADALGRFVFPELPAGSTYFLSATRVGYLSSDDVAITESRTISRIALGDGQWVRDARVALWRPASISGAVLDERGEPVVGAHVRVLQKVRVGGQERLAAGPVALTDDRGIYRIANLAKGRYVVALPSVQEAVPAQLSQGVLHNISPAAAARVAASMMTGIEPIAGVAVGGDDANLLLVGRYATTIAAAGLPRVNPGQYFPGTRDAANAAVVSVDYGEAREGVDFHLQSVPGWRVCGALHAPPDAQSQVTLRLVLAGNEALGAGSDTATTQSAADGRFCFLSVPAGHYTLLAGSGGGAVVMPSTRSATSTTGLAGPRVPAVTGSSGGQVVALSSPSEALGLAPSPGRGALYWARRAVDVADAEVGSVDVQMLSTASITGQLTLDPGSDLPVNRSAALVVEPSAANELLVVPQLVVSDSSSDSSAWNRPRGFQIPGLTPGQYSVWTTSRTAVVKSILWNGHDYADEAFDVSSSSPIADVVITITTRVATLAGTVRDANGLIAAGASVMCFSADRARWQQFGLTWGGMRSAYTNNTGGFRIDGVRAGDYYVVAVPDGAAGSWQDPAFLDAASRVAARITIDWGSALTQDLRLQTVKAR